MHAQSPPGLVQYRSTLEENPKIPYQCTCDLMSHHIRIFNGVWFHENVVNDLWNTPRIIKIATLYLIQNKGFSPNVRSMSRLLRIWILGSHCFLICSMGNSTFAFSENSWNHTVRTRIKIQMRRPAWAGQPSELVPMLYRIHRGHPKTTLTNFCPILTTYLPPVDKFTK